jgi:hypothetical protein
MTEGFSFTISSASDSERLPSLCRSIGCPFNNDLLKLDETAGPPALGFWRLVAGDFPPALLVLPRFFFCGPGEPFSDSSPSTKYKNLET